jgi:HK97 family phage major capsid protein
VTPVALLARRRAADAKVADLRGQLAATRSSDKRQRLRRGLDRAEQDAADAAAAFGAAVRLDARQAGDLAAIADELERLAALDTLDARQVVEWDELVAEVDAIEDDAARRTVVRQADDRRRAALEQHVRDRPRSLLRGSQPDDEPDEPTPAHRHTLGEIMSTTAHRAGPVADALDTLARSRILSDAATEVVARLVEADESTAAARWAAAASDPDYATAFGKVARDPAGGHRSFTTAELTAWQRAETVARALNLTTAGALVPTHLDPTINLASDGSVDPMRQIASTALVASDQWNGASSDGVTTEWLAEEAEVADASPTIDPVPIPVHKASAFVPVSFESYDDAQGLGPEVARLLLDGKTQAEAAAFLTGSGLGQPTGLLTSLGDDETVELAGASFAPADVDATIEALGGRFRQGASWLAGLPTMNTVEAFETTNGSLRYPSMQATPPTLHRKRIYEHSEMPDTIAVGEPILVVGDFRHYVIVDRVGATVELIPHLFGANRRPTGQRGWFLWWRVGGDARVPNAFRALGEKAPIGS